jgi:hypothetical protein
MAVFTEIVRYGWSGEKETFVDGRDYQKKRTPRRCATAERFSSTIKYTQEIQVILDIAEKILEYPIFQFVRTPLHSLPLEIAYFKTNMSTHHCSSTPGLRCRGGFNGVRWLRRSNQPWQKKRVPAGAAGGRLRVLDLRDRLRYLFLRRVERLDLGADARCLELVRHG